MRKVLNYLLLITFLLTILVPITGIHIHKLTSTLFLLLSLIHTFVYKNKLNTKRYLLILLIIISFISGIFALILGHIPFVLQLHKLTSIFIIFFLAIHIYIFQRRMK